MVDFVQASGITISDKSSARVILTGQLMSGNFSNDSRAAKSPNRTDYKRGLPLDKRARYQ